MNDERDAAASPILELRQSKQARWRQRNVILAGLLHAKKPATDRHCRRMRCSGLRTVKGVTERGKNIIIICLSHELLTSAASKKKQSQFAALDKNLWKACERYALVKGRGGGRKRFQV